MSEIFGNTVDLSFAEVEKYIRKSSVYSLVDHMKIKFKAWCGAVGEKYVSNFIHFHRHWHFFGSIDPANNDWQLIEQRAVCLKEHIVDLSRMYFSLGDYRSKLTFLGLIMYWLDFDIHKFNQMQERHFDTYFDLDLISCDKNEVFIDAGSFDGGTVLSYISNYGTDNYNRIICYEINRYNIEKMRTELKDYNNIDIRFKGLADKNCVMQITHSEYSGESSALQTEENGESVQVVTLDGDVGEEITFIKMDIEGAEYQALLGAQKHIINERPKMAISVYHSNDDLWRIFKLLNGICDGYGFYFRFNSRGPWEVNPFSFASDYILICVPRAL